MKFGRPRSPRRVLVVVLVTVLLVGCSGGNVYKPPPPPEVTVAQPVEREVSDYLEFTGTTKASASVDIRARVNGYLQGVEFADGAMMKKGDLLLKIEPEPFEAALALAKANLQKAEAALNLADAELKRSIPLVEKGALPDQELDLRKANQATAKADVAAAAATVTQAELNLSYTSIRAPISGRTSMHMVDIGNLVKEESTLLTRIESYTPIYAYFTVSENDVLRLMQLRGEQAATGDADTPPTLQLGLSDDQGFPFEGQLDFTDIGVDPMTGTQLRRGTFSNEDHRLVPGMFVRIRLPFGKPARKLMIAQRAIGTDQRGEYVLVVTKVMDKETNKEKNIVEHRVVELGISVNGMQVVNRGLEVGDWVVINGLQRAQPGKEVSPKYADKMADTTTTPRGDVSSTEAPAPSTSPDHPTRRGS